MVKTMLYAEKLYDNDKVEREVFGSDVRLLWRNVANLRRSTPRLRRGRRADDHALRRDRARHRPVPTAACVVRMGVGYDKIDRQAAASAISLSATCRITAPPR